MIEFKLIPSRSSARSDRTRAELKGAFPIKPKSYIFGISSRLDLENNKPPEHPDFDISNPALWSITNNKTHSNSLYEQNHDIIAEFSMASILAGRDQQKFAHPAIIELIKTREQSKLPNPDYIEIIHTPFGALIQVLAPLKKLQDLLDRDDCHPTDNLINAFFAIVLDDTLSNHDLIFTYRQINQILSGMVNHHKSSSVLSFSRQKTKFSLTI